MGVHACNVYTEEMLNGVPPDGTGGVETGGEPNTGDTGGRSATGGRSGGDTGGTSQGSGGDAGASAGGTGTGTGGATTGGRASGGADAGGAPSGGSVSTGGLATGGANPGGAPTGGVSTGGASPGGAPAGGATATGGTATGGAATGGAPTGGTLPTGFTEVDLLNEVNNTIELADGEGFWYSFHDDVATGQIDPDTQGTGLELEPVALPAERDGSLLGVHVTANNGFTEWGAGVGFDFNSTDANTKDVYDLTPYSGVAFWARSASGSVDMRVRVVTADIVPTTEPGGACTANCNDAFGYGITLTNQWQEVLVDFSSPPLAQEGWGNDLPAFDPTQAIGIQIQAAAGVAFDIWIDEVRFYD